MEAPACNSSRDARPSRSPRTRRGADNVGSLDRTLYSWPDGSLAEEADSNECALPGAQEKTGYAEHRVARHRARLEFGLTRAQSKLRHSLAMNPSDLP